MTPVGTVATRRAKRAEPEPKRVFEPWEAPGRSSGWAVDPHPGRDVGFPLAADRGGERLEKKIGSAEGFAREVRRQLREIEPGSAIAIGAGADPYRQPEERSLRTRTLLRALLERNGLTVTITTRSNLVTRDLELLAGLAGRHRLRVDVMVPTLDRRLAGAIDPDAPRPDLRLKAISRLSAAGIEVGASCAPVLPGVNDAPGALAQLTEAAVAAGISRLDARVFFLPPGSLVTRFPLLERELPDLVDRCRERYERHAPLPSEYRKGIAELMEMLRRKHGLVRDRGGPHERTLRERSQLSLF